MCVRSEERLNYSIFGLLMIFAALHSSLELRGIHARSRQENLTHGVISVTKIQNCLFDLAFELYYILMSQYLIVQMYKYVTYSPDDNEKNKKTRYKESEIQQIGILKRNNS